MAKKTETNNEPISRPAVEPVRAARTKSASAGKKSTEEKIPEKKTAGTGSRSSSVPGKKTAAPAKGRAGSAAGKAVAPKPEPAAEPAAAAPAVRRKLLYVCSECQPFAGTGGLGEVMGSLPASVAGAGDYDVSVMLPLYSGIAPEWRSRMKFLGSVYTSLSWRKQYCGVFSLERDGVTYYFLDNEYYFRRDGIYGHFDDGERFAFFSKSVFEVFPVLGFVPDIIHCNDWQTALVPVYLKTVYREYADFSKIRTVFTIHNIEYQGKYSMSILEDIFGIPKAFGSIVEYDGLLNLMKGAIQSCDFVSTVSPTYSREILTPYYSHGLLYILRDNAEKIRGILNGIDTVGYNPATDPSLFAHYDAAHLEGKARNKAELQKMLNLPRDPDVPVIAMISRLVPHKGIDLVREIIEDILKMRVQFIVLGKGDTVFENFFLDIQSGYSEKMRALIAFNSDLSRKIYAGADLFLMPSKSEPCGLSQMIACRYGTVPIVRETGGLADSIRDIGCEGGGNGFTFSNYNAHDLLDRIRGAVTAYSNNVFWTDLVRKVMAVDFSWKKSAGEYIRMYQSIVF